MKLSRGSYIVDFGRFRTSKGIEKQMVVYDTTNPGFEIRMNATSFATGLTWWKKFAKSNNIPNKAWTTTQEISKEQQEQERYSKDFE